ncbi:MAG TPA: relaxase domain-containing protein [Terrimesophilobacter sp.]|nr:relaxase domain-containing protein [Terrimesophilobacter sp.]
MGTPLTGYYTAEGTPPGMWLGSGLSGLDSDETGRIAAGDVVTEVQLSRLLGEGVDTATPETVARVQGDGARHRPRRVYDE